MADTCTTKLDQLLSQARGWLTPRVEAECPRHDAAKLRIFVSNLAAARDQVHLMEEGLHIDPAESLAATMEGLAESFARWPDGVRLERPAIQRFVAVLNQAAATAWALEVAMRIHAGAIAATDIETLACHLHRGAVSRASRLAADHPGGSGDAA